MIANARPVAGLRNAACVLLVLVGCATTGERSTPPRAEPERASSLFLVSQDRLSVFADDEDPVAHALDMKDSDYRTWPCGSFGLLVEARDAILPSGFMELPGFVRNLDVVAAADPALTDAAPGGGRMKGMSAIGGRAAREPVDSTRRVWILDRGVDAEHVGVRLDVELSRECAFASPCRPYERDRVAGDHGTMTAALVGSETIGIVPDVQVVSLNVFRADECALEDSTETKPCYVTNVRGYARALCHVAENGRSGDAVVIATTLEDEECGRDLGELRRILEGLAADGFVVSISAGNGQKKAHQWPSCLDDGGTWRVSAYDRECHLDGGSVHGANVNLSAPKGFYSLNARGKRQYYSGTSAAASAAAAILMATEGRPLESCGRLRHDDRDGILEPVACIEPNPPCAESP